MADPSQNAALQERYKEIHSLKGQLMDLERKYEDQGILLASMEAQANDLQTKNRDLEAAVQAAQRKTAVAETALNQTKAEFQAFKDKAATELASAQATIERLESAGSGESTSDSATGEIENGKKDSGGSSTLSSPLLSVTPAGTGSGMNNQKSPRLSRSPSAFASTSTLQKMAPDHADRFTRLQKSYQNMQTAHCKYLVLFSCR